MDQDKLKLSTTTDGQPPRPGYENSGAPAPINPKTGQHEAYWVLSEEERAKGFLRPVRYSYLHKKCGGVTRMGKALCETYARDPKYYGATMCCVCGGHFPLRTVDGWQFFWEPDGDPVGSDAEEAAEYFAEKKTAESQKHLGAGI
jgi:hypothetical protein